MGMKPPVNAFAVWLDRPFQPRRLSKPTGRRTRTVTIRYRGSFGRSAVKALIVLVLLAFMATAVGDRPGQDPGANRSKLKAKETAPTLSAEML
jgi:hypothetical protein